jgi:hypothetical protein
MDREFLALARSAGFGVCWWAGAPVSPELVSIQGQEEDEPVAVELLYSRVPGNQVVPGIDHFLVRTFAFPFHDDLSDADLAEQQRWRIVGTWSGEARQEEVPLDGDVVAAVVIGDRTGWGAVIRHEGVEVLLAGAGWTINDLALETAAAATWQELLLPAG